MKSTAQQLTLRGVSFNIHRIQTKVDEQNIDRPPTDKNRFRLRAVPVI